MTPTLVPLAAALIPIVVKSRLYTTQFLGNPIFEIAKYSSDTYLQMFEGDFSLLGTSHFTHLIDLDISLNLL